MGMADGAREMDMGRQVLAANDAFYRAFATRDFDRMDRLWAAVLPISCAHPGWNAVRGREAVIASWRSILSNPDSPTVVAANVTAHVVGDAAYVICEERINGAVLIATNVFVREAGEWRLTHHQAGHVLARIAQLPAPSGNDRGVN
jgi:ketosteroid isomerase-like protein